MKKMLPDFVEERKLLEKYSVVIGVDEVGRAALAGRWWQPWAEGIRTYYAQNLQFVTI